MSSKRKAVSTGTSSADPAHAGTPGAEEPLHWEALAVQQRVQPIDHFDKFLEEFREVWPDEGEVEEFLAELRRWRREEQEDE
jgi:hypothetical protein